MHWLAGESVRVRVLRVEPSDKGIRIRLSLKLEDEAAPAPPPPEPNAPNSTLVIGRFIALHISSVSSVPDAPTSASRRGGASR